MNTEEKAKAYDEALERAKDCLTDRKFSETDDTVRSFVEYIFPELAESEDERIRKYLIEELKAAKSVGELKFIIPQPTREECIAYLEKQKDLDKMIVVSPEVWDNAISEAYENGKKEGEKQKEQKPLTAEETELNSIAFLEQMGYTCIPPGKEQKPNCKYECPLTDEQLMTTDFWKAYLKESLIPGAKPNKQDIEFLLPTARNYFSLIMKDVCTICKDWSNGYRKGLESGKQKPAEWSDDDREISQIIMGFLKEPSTASLCPQLCKESQNWLKSLPERFNLQHKKEWSEEDEEIFNNIIEKAKSGHWIEVNEITWLITRLNPSVLLGNPAMSR